MKLCPCGKPLHYTDIQIRHKVQALVDKLGEMITVQCGVKRYKVSRHYIALHGLKGRNLDQLGFEEVK